MTQKGKKSQTGRSNSKPRKSAMITDKTKASAKARQKALRNTDEVPEGVIDVESYEKYVQLRDSDIMNKTEHHTTDPNTVVNLRMSAYQLNKKIAHLAKDEQELIQSKATAIRKLSGTLLQLKKKAFGIRQGPYGIQESILDSKASELLEYFGRFFSAPEVHKIVTLEWGYDVNLNTVELFRKRHMDRIKEKQEEYKRDYSDVRLGHKRSRLDELQYLYTHRKTKYEISENKDDYRLLLQTIEQIRKEVEGDKLTIDGHLQMDVEHTVNMHIQNEMLKHVLINDIVIGRLSAKVGIDPRLMIHKLHSSYYAKFTGFKRPDISLEDDEPIYPSKFVYNFDEIANQNKQLEKDDVRFLEAIPVVEEDKKEHFKDVKQIMLEKIRNKQQQINGSQERIDNHTNK